ncbi:MAG: DNA gyrase subunit A [archaeon]
MTEKEEPRIEGKIITQVIEDEMKTAYLSYAMSVIVGRALPDVRDGLKPVHRRILYAMNDMGMRYNHPYKKCARIVGEVLGKYHPHGDTAVYDSLVRMAQTFSLRYLLIDGQGNFGSIDGDNPAAMRYTEARMAKLSDELIQDIDKDTVDFLENFDGSLKEPTVLPSKVPNLLINGSSGIAVGMATNIPPHNLSEVSQGVIELINNPDITNSELNTHIQGPDFPTGGIIAGRSGIISAYETGRGKVLLKGIIVQETKKERELLIVKEIPYMVNKSMLVKEIANGVQDKRIEGISDLRDESDRNGIRIVIELKRNATPEIVLNQLYKHTRLQTTFGVIMVALVNNEPKVLSLKELLQHYLDHRVDVVKRRTKFDLKKSESRAHVLEGLLIALQKIDAVIKLIRASESVEKAKKGLMTSFKLSQIQALAILDMKLQKLAKLERGKIEQEYKELLELIRELKEILKSQFKILEIIKNELKYLVEKYGDDRRTQISEDEELFDIEDLIEEEDVVITMTHAGYIKRLPIDTYKVQRRGGTGVIATETKEEDFVEDVFIANTHSYLLVLTDKGKVHWLKVYQIPEAVRQAKGRPIINLVNVEPGEQVKAVIPVKEFDDKHFLLTVTKKGIVKKTSLLAYSRPRKGGIIALKLDEGDQVVGVVLTDGSKNILMATKKGFAVKCAEKDIRPMGRVSRGVKGVSLRDKDELIGLVIAEDDKKVLTITENGFGKKTPISDYRFIKRGGKGVINIKTTERNGCVVAIKNVSDDDELMFISRNGIVIRTPSADISTIGRNTQGVRLMRMKGDDFVVSAAKIVFTDS